MEVTQSAYSDEVRARSFRIGGRKGISIYREEMLRKLSVFAGQTNSLTYLVTVFRQVFLGENNLRQQIFQGYFSQ